MSHETTATEESGIDQMVLNQASLTASNKHEALYYLKDIAIGIAILVNCKRVQSIIRTQYPIQEIRCCKPNEPFVSLYCLIHDPEIRKSRESYRLLATAFTKTPLLDGLSSTVGHRFYGCEVRGLSPEDGEPLLLCALFDTVAIGFLSQPQWDRDQITVEFDELLNSEHIEQHSETIDHLSGAGHAYPIRKRHRELLSITADPTAIWRDRADIFPCLRFGPGVEQDLSKLPRNFLKTVIKRLKDLDQAIILWRNSDAPTPPCGCKLTPESDTVMQDPKRRKARLFASDQGRKELFAWHTRFGKGGRIHLRLDQTLKEVEIGYIGQHLPL